MPARNTRRKRVVPPGTAEGVRVGEVPHPASDHAPMVIAKKTFQQALLDGLEDPVVFARDFLDCDPYPAQQQFLRNSRDSVEATFVAGNRTGKTWVGGLLLVWRAFYRYVPPVLAPKRTSSHTTYKAVSVSLTHDQAKLAWNYAMTFIEHPRFRQFVIDVVHSPFPTIRLRVKDERNEWVVSEIWARSIAKGGIHLLGHSLGFLLVDECAYIREYPRIEDEVLRMRLADQGGALFRLSTPNGKNFFFDYYQEGISGKPYVYAQRVPTTENPYISPLVIEQMRQRMTPEFYAQNVLAEFVAHSGFFRGEYIEALYTDVEYTDDATSSSGILQPPDPNGVYVLGADLGAARDPTVVIVWRIDTTPCHVVAVAEFRNPTWQTQRELVNQLYQRYHPIQAVVDATGVGAPIVQQLQDDDGWKNVLALVFNQHTKLDVLVRLQDAIQRRRFVFPYTTSTKPLVHQLGFYTIDDKAIEQDYVIALALTNYAYELVKKQQQMSTVVYEDLTFVEAPRTLRSVWYDRTPLYLPQQEEEWEDDSSSPHGDLFLGVDVPPGFWWR